MKETYHICFTSHEEVMFRDEEDHGVFLNLLALRGYSHETQILADAEMSTHAHLGIFSEKPQEFAAALRMSYTKYFNRKYGREGRFGQKYTFQLRIDGMVHTMVMLNYILRNGLHHGAAATAFGYPYCAVRALFPGEIGQTPETIAPMSRANMRSFLPRHAEFPDHYQMNAQGIFARSSFMEIRMAERYYVSPRNYLYQMNRLTDESWTREQEKDNTGKALTIYDIEFAKEQDIEQMLKNESGRNYQRSRLQDLDVCRLIDKELILPFGLTSVYQLTNSQRQRIARQLFYDFHVPDSQISRCLVLPLLPR